MAKTRALSVGEVDLLGVFIPPDRVEAIRVALKEGKSVLLEESEFKDPGEDYCKVIVEGTCMAYLPGY